MMQVKFVDHRIKDHRPVQKVPRFGFEPRGCVILTACENRCALPTPEDSARSIQSRASLNRPAR